jgi:hypothetical protein
VVESRGNATPEATYVKGRRQKQREPKVLSAPRTVEDEDGWVRILGVYRLPLFPESLLVEAIEDRPADRICAFSYGFPSRYSEVGDDSDQCEFHLSPDGETLLGFGDDAPRGPGPVRFAFLIHGCDGVPFTLDTPHGKVRIQRATPVPERLLRLIWIEDSA